MEIFISFTGFVLFIRANSIRLRLLPFSACVSLRWQQGQGKLKAYLNGVDTPGMFGASTLIVKAGRAPRRVFCYQWKMACMPDIQGSHDSSNVKEYSKVFRNLVIFSKSIAKISYWKSKLTMQREFSNWQDGRNNEVELHYCISSG